MSTIDCHFFFCNVAIVVILFLPVHFIGLIGLLVEVENMFGLSNFVPILFGSKQLYSELERIQDALCGSSNSNLFGELPGASSDPYERQRVTCVPI